MEERSLKCFDDDIPSQLDSNLLDKLGFKPNSDLIDIIVKEFENYMVAYNRYHYAHPETKLVVRHRELHRKHRLVQYICVHYSASLPCAFVDLDLRLPQCRTSE